MGLMKPEKKYRIIGIKYVKDGWCLDEETLITCDTKKEANRLLKEYKKDDEYKYYVIKEVEVVYAIFNRGGKREGATSLITYHLRLKDAEEDLPFWLEDRPKCYIEQITTRTLDVLQLTEECYGHHYW